MGNYIKHIETGKQIKIGKMDEAFYSRNTLLDFKKSGYKGFCNGQFNDELDEILEDEETLYSFDNELAVIEWNIENKVFYLPATGLTHNKINLKHNNYNYEVGCQEAGSKIIKAIMVGERYKDGKLRTIFRCNCCSMLFTIDHVTAMLLRNLFPIHKKYFNSKSNYDVSEQDCSLHENLELLTDIYTYEDMILLIRSANLQEIENYIKKYDHKNLWEFYQYNLSMKEHINKLLKGVIEIGTAE